MLAEVIHPRLGGMGARGLEPLLPPACGFLCDYIGTLVPCYPCVRRNLVEFGGDPLFSEPVDSGAD